MGSIRMLKYTPNSIISYAVALTSSRDTIDLNEKKEALKHEKNNLFTPIEKQEEKENELKSKQDKYEYLIPSKKSMKKLRQRINIFSLMECNKKKLKRQPIPNKSNTQIFVTLTLPATQDTNTNTLNNTALKDMLNILRNVYKVQNYLWRIEFQKNGNAHYHLLIDRYIAWQNLRRTWNGVLLKYGYIQRYQKRMQNMSQMEYLEIRKYRNDKELQKLVRAYDKGEQDNWSNPNTIDVDKITSAEKLKKYLSKYFRKTSKKDINLFDKIKRRESKRFRHFGTSYTLSRVEFPTVPITNDNAIVPWEKMMKHKQYHVKQRYFEIIYFKEQKNAFYQNYKRRLFEFIEEQAYFL